MTERLNYSDRVIRAILASVKTIALVGASPNEARPANLVMRYLLSKGYRVIPVNPGHAGRLIHGKAAYASLAEIPEAVDMVDVFRRQEALAGLVDEAIAMKPRPRVIWMQLGLRDDTAAAKAEAAGMTVIMDRCPKIEFGRLCGAPGFQHRDLEAG